MIIVGLFIYLFIDLLWKEISEIFNLHDHNHKKIL
jgi:hypothetical protein